jgi:hypothetical protein
MEYILSFFSSCCSCYKQNKVKREEEVIEKAKLRLNDWKVDLYSKNRYLQKIPESKEREQLRKFIEEIENE